MGRCLRWRLPVLPPVLGLTDGILTALALAAGAILRGAGVGIDLAMRVGVVSGVTAAFTLFVADYADRRAHLVRASKQLNLTAPGRLAATSLGRVIVRESTFAALVAALASFVGAAVPLLLAAALPVLPWVALAFAIVLLGVLGGGIGAMLRTGRVRWAIAMLLGGAAVAVIGAVLDIA